MTQLEETFELIKKENQTALSISLLVNFPIATVHKRIVDLYNDGLIKQTGKYIITPDNKTYAIYKIVKNNDIEYTKQKRHIELNQQWIIQGYKNGYISKTDYDFKMLTIQDKLNNLNKWKK